MSGIRGFTDFQYLLAPPQQWSMEHCSSLLKTGPEKIQIPEIQVWAMALGKESYPFQVVAEDKRGLKWVLEDGRYRNRSVKAKFHIVSFPPLLSIKKWWWLNVYILGESISIVLSSHDQMKYDKMKYFVWVHKFLIKKNKNRQ